MVRWIDQPSIVPFIACVPDGQKHKFRDFVVSRMMEETRQDDGRCFETFRRLNVYAKVSRLPLLCCMADTSTR
jgi:trans-aconitate methyltransferase